MMGVVDPGTDGLIELDGVTGEETGETVPVADDLHRRIGCAPLLGE